MHKYCFSSICVFNLGTSTALANTATPAEMELTFSTLQIAIGSATVIVGVALILFIRSYWNAPSQKATSTFRKMLSEFPVMVIILGVLLLAIGVSLTDHGWSIFKVDFDFVGHLVAEFGIALIIAYFISISIEEYARRRHNTHVAERAQQVCRGSARPDAGAAR